jgi:peroxiredoxin
MNIGNTVSDFAFLRSDGTPVSLSVYLDREYLLIVFLRHLA